MHSNGTYSIFHNRIRTWGQKNDCIVFQRTSPITVIVHSVSSQEIVVVSNGWWRRSIASTRWLHKRDAGVIIWMEGPQAVSGSRTRIREFNDATQKWQDKKKMSVGSSSVLPFVFSKLFSGLRAKSDIFLAMVMKVCTRMGTCQNHEELNLSAYN